MDYGDAALKIVRDFWELNTIIGGTPSEVDRIEKMTIFEYYKTLNAWYKAHKSKAKKKR